MIGEEAMDVYQVRSVNEDSVDLLDRLVEQHKKME